MSKLKSILINLSLSFTIFFLLSVSLLLLDLYEHNKMEKYMGFNYRGYRGEIVGKKEPNEIRIVVLGGSCAYGFGAMASETIPYCLGKIINNRFKYL